MRVADPDARPGSGGARAADVPVIAVDRKASTPLYRQVYDGYRHAILQRRLRGGDRLPSTRSLSKELRISRLPILRAFEQLIAEGYCEGRPGAGTYVAASIASQVAPQAPPARTAADGAPRRLEPAGPAANVPPPPPWLGGHGPFAVGGIAVDRFPVDVWRRLLARHANRGEAALLRYGPSAGLPRLRQAIAAYLRAARAVRCEPDQILVVSGSQQALDLVARVLVEPGSPVWLEEPGYWGVRDAFQVARARLVPVPVDAQGLCVASGAAMCPRASAVVVTPSHHFPTGVVMSAARRLELLGWARESGAWIVEDDYDSEYRFESPPVAALQGLDADGRVLYIGTFSKVLSPGLRLGYLVVPPDLVTRFTAARWAMDISSPMLSQAALADFLDEGHFARHLKRMRQLYGERRAALADLLRRELGDLLAVTGDAAGLFLAAELVGGGDDREIAVRAAAEGLRAVPISSCYLGPPMRRGLAMGYGSTSRLEMTRAVRILGRVMREPREHTPQR